MSYITADRVKESSTIIGTGTIPLLGSAVGFRTFASQMSVGDTCSYVIANTTGSEWEVGIATYSAANTLTRTTVQSSTNANAVVNFSAGMKDVFISPTAQSVIDYNPITHQISNADSIVASSVASGVGNSLTITAGNGVGVGAGGNIVLAPGSQGSSGGNGKVIINNDANINQLTIGKGISQGYDSTAFGVEALNSSSSVLSNTALGYHTLKNTDGAANTAIGSYALEFNNSGYYGTAIGAYALYVNTNGNQNTAVGAECLGSVTTGNSNVAIGAQAGANLVNGSNNILIGKTVYSPATSTSNFMTIGNLIFASGGFGTYNDIGTGNVGIGQASPTAKLHVKGSSSSTQGVIVQGASSQTANLQEWQNSAATALAYVNASGTLYDNAVSALPVASGVGNNLTLTAGSGVGTGAGGSLVLQAGVQATSGGDGKVVVKQVAGQTSNLQEWQDSSGNIRGYISATDSSTIARFALGRSDGSEGFYVTTTNGGTRGLWLTNSMMAAFGCTAVNNTDGGSIVPGSAIATRGDVGEIGFGAGTNPASRDVVLRRDAAGTLAQRNGTNPQAFRVYNTYTDASNYERFGITWASNVCTIGLAQAGTGLPRTLNVNVNALNAPALPVAATVTAATGNGTTVTYTCASTFAIGQVVSITGLTITTGSSLNLSNQTITGVTTTAFTVTNATVGTAAATQTGTATIQSAGNSVTITAGNGSGVGAGGNIILQPGAQGTSGGNGSVKFYDVTGANTRMGAWNNSTQGYGFGWDTQNNGTLGSGLVSSSVNGTGYIGVKSQLTNHFMIETSNGTTALLTNSANTQSRLIFVNGNNAQTTSGSAGICSYTTGVITIRDGGTSIAGGSFSFPSSTTAIATNQNDLILTGSAFQRINCTVASSLTGIAPPTGGTHVDGRMIRIYNVGAANLTLAHNSTASTTAANRFWNSTGADIILATHQYVELIYDSTDNGRGGAGWRVSSIH